MLEKESEEIKILAPVPKTFGWYVGLWFWGFLWIFMGAKTWKEFYYGLIDHEHEFDFKKMDKEGYSPCKHYGCNLVTPDDENGIPNWKR